MGSVTVFSLGVTGGKPQMAWAILLPTTEQARRWDPAQVPTATEGSGKHRTISLLSQLLKLYKTGVGVLLKGKKK